MTTPVRLTAHALTEPLTEPYRLPFGTVAAFDTVYVRLDGDDRVGLGEITPLPGYSDETPDSVRAALALAGRRADEGVPLEDIVAGLEATDPFVASGLACALETWRVGAEAAFAPLVGRVPVIGLCQGATTEAAATTARALVAEGHRTLKLKVGGRPVDDDIAILRAVHAAIADDTALRLDANQVLTPDAARVLCRAIADGLPRVAHLEQPFGHDDWDGHARLIAEVPVPIMLDESISTVADVDRAAQIGARAVKLKLCKHPGSTATLAVIDRARDRGLEVVLGNGVQTALGNHLEAALWLRAGLTLASEGVGFAKQAAPRLRHRLSLSDGYLTSGGIDVPANIDGDVVLETAARARTPVL